MINEWWKTMLGNDRWMLLHGDCIDKMRHGDVDSIDLAFADPPYNIGINYGDHYDDQKSDEAYLSWCAVWIAEIKKVLKPNGAFWLLVNHEYAADLDVMIRKTGFHRQQWITWYESFGVNCSRKFNRCSRPLLWYTKHPTKFTANYLSPEVRRPSARMVKYGDKRANPNGKLWDDVWGIDPLIPRVCGTFKERIKEFPTQLPMKLLRPIVAFSSNPGDLVLDPFSGSATTGAVCLELGRRYLGIELGEENVIRSGNRLRQIESEVATSA